MRAIVIDIGGTQTRCAQYDPLTNNLSFLVTFATPKLYSALIDQISSWLRRQLPVGRLSISISAEVDSLRGDILASNKLSFLVGTGLVDDLRAITGTKVYIAHDCVSALAGEINYDRKSSAGYVTISTGVGAAVYVATKNGGALSMVRLGHTSIDMNGRICACGRVGCLSAYVDSQQTSLRLGMPMDSVPDKYLLDEYVERLVDGLLNFAISQTCNYIVLGGGVILSRPLLLQRALDLIKARSTLTRMKVGQFRVARYGLMASLVGAGSIAEVQNLIG